ncbi:MAG: hypothetical protein AB1486_09935 [Planctomycetota bacterium]
MAPSAASPNEDSPRENSASETSPSELLRLLQQKHTLLQNLRSCWLEAQMAIAGGRGPREAERPLIEAEAVIARVREIDRAIDEIDAVSPAEPRLQEWRQRIGQTLGELSHLHQVLDQRAIERLAALGRELAQLREGRDAVESYRPWRDEHLHLDRNA